MDYLGHKVILGRTKDEMSEPLKMKEETEIKKKIETPKEIIELRKTVDTINALKQQKHIILNSQGDNKKIDRETLSAIQKNINPLALKNEYLKDFMKENSIESYIDVDVIKFMQFFNKKTDMKFVVK